LGLVVLGVDFETIWGRFLALCKDFHFDKAFDFVFSKDTLNVFIAYIIASFFISFLTYLLSYVIIKIHRARKART